MAWFGLVATCALTNPAGASSWPGSQERIVAGLASDDLAERRNAATRLLELPPRLAGELASKALRDTDVEVRLAAARSAARLGLERVGDEAAAWLQESDVRLRLAACELTEVGPTAASLAAVGRVLGDARPEVRAAAATAMGASGDPTQVGVLLGHLDDTSVDVRLAVTRALGRLGDPRAAIPLVSKLQDPELEMRVAVAAALGALREPGSVPSLELALRDRDVAVKIAVVLALGRIGSPGSVSAIAPWLGAESSGRGASPSDAGLRSAAAEALARIGTGDAVRALVGELEREGPLGYSEDAVAFVRSALARTDGAEAILIGLLDSSSNSRLATAAALALGAVARGPGRGASALAIVRAGRRGLVEIVSGLRALERLGEPEALPFVFEQLAAPESAVRECAVEVAARLIDPASRDGRVVDVVAARLGHADVSSGERASLFRLLGRTGSPRAMSLLLASRSTKQGEVPRGEPARVTQALVEALGELGIPSAEVEEFLLDGLSHEVERVRTAAARSLGKIGGDRAARALLERLARGAAVDRTAVGLALSGALARSTEPGLVARVSEMFVGANGAMRDAILEGLGRSSAPGVAGWLESVARGSDADDRRKVAEAIGGRSDSMVLATTLARDPDPGVRASAQWSLGRMGRSEGLAVALQGTADPDVSVVGNALVAVARLGGASQVATLCSRLDHPRSYVRAAALAGLSLVPVSCPEGRVRRTLLVDRSATVRAAAARLLLATSSTSTTPVEDGRADSRRLDGLALARCADDDRDASVAEVCRRRDVAAPSTRRHDVLVYVIPDAGSEPVPRAPFALVLPDGTMRFGTADRRGAVFEREVPAGRIALAVPAALAP